METTGLKADKDEIIEIGAVRFTADGRDARVVDRFVSFVCPGRSIPLRIQQITGINDGDVADAPAIDEVLPELRAFIGPEVRGIIAHNAGFDLGFLRAAGLDVQRPAFDTFELASILMPGRASYSLGELCRNEGIALVDAHRAFDDAEACARLFARLLDRLHGLPAPTLRALVESSSRSEASWSPQILFEGALAGAMDGTFEEVADRDDWERPVDDAFSEDLPPDELSGGAGKIDERRKITRVEPTALADFFGETGHLARTMGAAFERRDGQAEMAARVLASLNRGDHLLIEAGTGTGKSLAYLLPSALWSVQNGRRVVVATYTLALQEQLVESEVPRLLDLLASAGRDLPEVALLKGRSHYLCTRRFARWREQIGARAKGPSKLELRVLAKVLVWLLFTETGDVNELFLPTDAEQAVWQQICSHTACNAQRCNLPADDPATTSGLGAYHRDFAVAAREAAMRAHLLIINHALLFADLAAGRRVLPAFSHLIVDEAHHLEDAATDQLTFTAHWSRAAGLLRRLLPNQKTGGALHGALHQLLDVDVRQGKSRAVGAALTLADLGVEVGQALDLLPAFNERLLRFAKHQKGRRQNAKYNQRLALDEAVRVQPEWSRVEIEWDHIAGRLRTVADLAEGLRRSLVESGWHKREPASTHLAELEATASDLREFTRRLDQIILQTTSGAGGASTNDALFFRTLFDLPPADEAAAETKSPKLFSNAPNNSLDLAQAKPLGNLTPTNPITNLQLPISSPLDREPTVAWLETNQRTEEATLLLAPRRVGSLLEQALVHDMRTAIFTGATLRTAEGFGFTRDRLGLWEVEAATVDSPFDYATNTLLYPAQRHASAQQSGLSAGGGAGGDRGGLGDGRAHAGALYLLQPASHHRRRRAPAAGCARHHRFAARGEQPLAGAARISRGGAGRAAGHALLLGGHRPAGRPAALSADRQAALCRARRSARRRALRRAGERFPRLHAARRDPALPAGLWPPDPPRGRSRRGGAAGQSAVAEAVWRRLFGVAASVPHAACAAGRDGRRGRAVAGGAGKVMLNKFLALAQHNLDYSA